MSNMRGLDTQVRAIRRRVFKEVAKLGFEANSETQHFFITRKVQ